MITRRTSLQHLLALLAITASTGCVDEETVGMIGDQQGLPHNDLEGLLAQALPLGELEAYLTSWSGGREQLIELSPLGLYALSHSEESADQWEARIRAGLVIPLQDLERSELATEIEALAIQDYDSLNITELKGWWLSDREVLCCVVAKLIAYQETTGSSSL